MLATWNPEYDATLPVSDFEDSVSEQVWSTGDDDNETEEGAEHISKS